MSSIQACRHRNRVDAYAEDGRVDSHNMSIQKGTTNGARWLGDFRYRGVRGQLPSKTTLAQHFGSYLSEQQQQRNSQFHLQLHTFRLRALYCSYSKDTR